jgi:hypothetical protein
MHAKCEGIRFCLADSQIEKISLKRFRVPFRVPGLPEGDQPQAGVYPDV